MNKDATRSKGHRYYEQGRYLGLLALLLETKKLLVAIHATRNNFHESSYAGAPPCGCNLARRTLEVKNFSARKDKMPTPWWVYMRGIVCLHVYLFVVFNKRNKERKEQEVQRVKERKDNDGKMQEGKKQ